jgi:hypothetical protein
MLKFDSHRLTLLLAIGLILVALVIFLASALTPPAVVFQWSTASELDTAGFNVLRSDQPAGPFTRLNAEIIPASPDPLVGGSYIYTDTNVLPGQTYYYALEEVEFSGNTNPQGSTAVTAQFSVEPILIVGGVIFAVGLIVALIWLERPRRPAPQP